MVSVASQNMVVDNVIDWQTRVRKSREMLILLTRKLLIQDGDSLPTLSIFKSDLIVLSGDLIQSKLVQDVRHLRRSRSAYNESLLKFFIVFVRRYLSVSSNRLRGEVSQIRDPSDLLERKRLTNRYGAFRVSQGQLIN